MPDITRRSLLGTFVLGASVAAGAGAGLLRPVHHKIAVPPTPPPDALVIALNDSRRLEAAYTAALPRDPADQALLTSLRSDVTEHQRALLALLETYPGWRYEQALPTTTLGPSATPYPSPTPGAPIAVGGDALRAALAKAAASLATACVGWPATEPNASEAIGLLGSMSATLATHVQALS